MASSSPSTGRTAKENLRRALGNVPNSHVSSWETPNQALGDPSGGLTYPSPRRQTYTTTHNYGAPSYTNNSMISNQNSYHGSEDQLLNSYSPQPFVKGNKTPDYETGQIGVLSQFNSQAARARKDSGTPDYEMGQLALLSQFNAQPTHEHEDYNDSNSELDFVEEGAANADQIYEGIIRSEAHYNEIIGLKVGKATVNHQVLDIPETEEEQNALVKQLFESIMDTTDVLDKANKNGKPAQAVCRIRSGYYTSKDIEVKCWEIMIMCRDAAIGHEIPGCDPHSKKEDFEGFVPRFQKIVESCRISKALCKQIMDPPYISRLVAAPGAEIRMKYNNKKINAERDIQNELGRRAVRDGISLIDLARLRASAAELPTSSLDAASDIKIPVNELDSPIPMDIGKPKSTVTPNTVAPKTPKRVAAPKKAARSTSTMNTSTKRKASRASKLKADDNDSDYETPVKRSRRSTKPRAKGTPTKAQGDNKTPQDNNRNPLSVMSASPGAAPLDGTFGSVGQDFLMSGALNNMNLGSFFVAPASNRLSGELPVLPNGINMPELEPLHPTGHSLNEGLHPTELLYKRTICDLLEVNQAWTTIYSLQQLRTYARAYNTEFLYNQWRYDANYSGIGHALIDQYGNICCPHFALQLSDYYALAVARGDVTQDWNYIENAPYALGFPTQTDLMIRQALGLEDNMCGIHDDQNNHGNHPQQLMPKFGQAVQSATQN